jgi:hypothetical protein
VQRRRLLEANIKVVPDRVELSEKLELAPGDDSSLCRFMVSLCAVQHAHCLCM